jgi:hypothetical protein
MHKYVIETVTDRIVQDGPEGALVATGPVFGRVANHEGTRETADAEAARLTAETGKQHRARRARQYADGTWH